MSGPSKVHRLPPYPGTVALTVSLRGPGSLRLLIHLPMKCAVWLASLPFPIPSGLTPFAVYGVRLSVARNWHSERSVQGGPPSSPDVPES